MSQIVRMFIKEALQERSILFEREPRRGRSFPSGGEEQQSQTRAPAPRREKPAGGEASKKEIAYHTAIIDFINKNVDDLTQLKAAINIGDLVADVAWVDDIEDLLDKSAAIDALYDSSGAGKANFCLITAAAVIYHGDVSWLNQAINNLPNMLESSVRRKMILKEWTPAFIKKVIIADSSDAIDDLMKKDIIATLKADAENLTHSVDDIAGGFQTINVTDTATGTVGKRYLKDLFVVSASEVLKKITLGEMDVLASKSFRAFIDDLIKMKKLTPGSSKNAKELLSKDTNKALSVQQLLDDAGTSIEDISVLSWTNPDARAFATKLSGAFDEAALEASYDRVAREAADEAIKSGAAPSTVKQLGKDALSATGAEAKRQAIKAGRKALPYVVGIGMSAAAAAAVATAFATYDDPEKSGIVANLANFDQTKMASILAQEFTPTERNDFYDEMKEVSDDVVGKYWDNDAVEKVMGFATLVKNARLNSQVSAG